MKQTKVHIDKSIFIFARACVRELSRAFILVGLVYSTGLIADERRNEIPTVHTLEQALKSDDLTERIAASQVLGQKGAEVSETQFQTIREGESNPLVRHQINKTAGQSLQSNASKLLLDSLKNDKDSLVRQGAAQSLGNYVQENEVVETLAEFLGKDSNPGVRYACALSLGISNSFKALSALEKAATDPDANLRRQVASSLHRFSDKRAQKTLKQLQRDSDDSVRKMAGALR